MNKLTETEKAYIAGLLDGEGCIGIQKKKSQHTKYPFDFQVRVIITNSYFPTICWLKEKTGIGCAYEYNKSFKENWNSVHRWQVVANQATEFLEMIYPYIQIKKEIANLILMMPKGRKQGKIRTIKEYQIQENIFSQAKAKNKRGKE